MGSSYRSDLNRGHMPGWEYRLRTACKAIASVIDEVQDCIGDETQYDNAAADGALAEKLGLAKRLIEEELPKQVGDSGER